MESADLSPAHILPLFVHCTALAGLALFGLHRILLVVRYYRLGPEDPPEPDEAPLPPVLVQIPVYNEPRVVGRVIAAAAALEYPRDRLRIQILDDSDDETPALAARAVHEARESGTRIEHIRRTGPAGRAGYKAGALAAGMQDAEEELVAIFDADFIPCADFLLRMVPSFRDPAVGFVQARWEHLNADQSLLTRIQALMLDAHFMIEHGARSRAGWLFNFNGTAGLWRRRAIIDAGGWTSDTLTEDLDLSYRAGLAGWKARFRPDVAVPSELPATLAALRTQQRRWAAGSIQCARKLTRAILSSRRSAAERIDAAAHLWANLCLPMLAALCASLLPVQLMRENVGADLPVGPTLTMLLFGAGAMAVFHVNARRELGGSPVRTLMLMPALLALGAGLSVNTTFAVLQGLFTRGGEFVRTPKGGGPGAAVLSPRSRGGRTLVGLLFAEVSLFVMLLGASGLAIGGGRWGEAVFPAMFAWGFGYVLARTALEKTRTEARSAHPPPELKVENFSPRPLNAG